MKTSLRSFALAAVMAVAAAGGAAAATISFSGLSTGANPTLENSGFVFTTANVVRSNCLEKRCLGLTGSTSTTMSLASGGAFTLESLWLKLRGASKLNNLSITATGAAGSSISLDKTNFTALHGAPVSFGDAFKDVISITFTGNDDSKVLIDDITTSVTDPAPVPVPAAAGLLLVGLGALGFARRRKA